MTPEPLSTARLRLVPAGPELLDLLIGGPAAFRAATRLALADGCLEFPEALDFTRQQLSSAAPDCAWWTPWLFIHPESQTVIGLGGYKGPPDAEGYVEFGYGTAFEWRGRGFATEAALALVTHAFRQPGIHGVRAHSLAEINASTRILARCGLVRVAEIDDPTDGRIWRWELARPTPDAESAPPRPARIAIPTLAADRLILRPYQADDLPAFLALNRDENVRAHVGGPLGKFDAVRHLDRFVEGECTPGNEAWAVVDRQSGEYLGHCWLARPEGAAAPQIGYLVAHEHWGHGLGTELARTLVRYVLGPAGYARVEAIVDTDNPASVRVLERAGLRRVGEYRERPEQPGTWLYAAERD